MSDPSPSSVELRILLALSLAPLHGYGIMQEVARQSGGEVAMGPGTLYGAIKRMLKAGWIAQAAGGSGQDPRRTARYRLTPAGRAAAHQGARGLSQIVELAVRSGILQTRAQR
jgi:DNA-binding PadR family transcriptional regulator